MSLIDNFNLVAFRKLRENLELFKVNQPLLFQSLFQKNRLIIYKGNLLDIFVDFGLVQQLNNEWVSPYIIREFQELFILTDPFDLPEINRVFPLSEDESFFLAKRLAVNSNGTVLDIGTGSGIYAICMARNAKHVVATDINDKALKYAHFNACLNDLSHKIDFRKSDVYENIYNESFSHIISNPAVIPAPANSNFFIHSDGGPLGINMSSRIIQDAYKYLTQGGKLQMICTSLSDIHNQFVIKNEIAELYRNLDFPFSMEELYSPPLEPLSKLYLRYKDTPCYDEFKLQLEKSQYNQLHYLYIEATREGKFEFLHKSLEKTFSCNDYCGSWEGRLNRLFLVYNKMKNATPSPIPLEI
ncbi:MAG: methyltransferase [Saprospiraceae bacterium]|nr:methyltransferase [Saprospiraceae bacterium]